VKPGVELVPEQLVDQAMAPHQLVLRELLADHHQLEVGLCTFRNSVHVALVDHLQM
jgi:hypothetical protein